MQLVQLKRKFLFFLREKEGGINEYESIFWPFSRGTEEAVSEVSQYKCHSDFYWTFCSHISCYWDLHSGQSTGTRTNSRGIHWLLFRVSCFQHVLRTHHGGTTSANFLGSHTGNNCLASLSGRPHWNLYSLGSLYLIRVFWCEQNHSQRTFEDPEK